MDSIEELRYLILGAQREGARALAELLRPARLTAAQGEVLAVLRDADHPPTGPEIGGPLPGGGWGRGAPGWCGGGAPGAGSSRASWMPDCSSAGTAPVTGERSS